MTKIKNKGKQNKCKADIGRRLGDVILVIRSNLNRSCLEVPVRFGAGSRDRTWTVLSPTHPLPPNQHLNTGNYSSIILSFEGLYRISGLFYIRYPVEYPVSFAGYPAGRIPDIRQQYTGNCRYCKQCQLYCLNLKNLESWKKHKKNWKKQKIKIEKENI